MNFSRFPETAEARNYMEAHKNVRIALRHRFSCCFDRFVYGSQTEHPFVPGDYGITLSTSGASPTPCHSKNVK
jgi:hypothetical protein